MLSRIFKSLPINLALAAIVIGGLQFGFSGVPARASDLSSWQHQVVKRIAQKQVYPRAALSQELEGKAKVKVSIDRSGAITHYEMIQSTGHELLDAEVVKLMARINPLPTPPANLPEDALTFVLPLSWVLQ